MAPFELRENQEIVNLLSESETEDEGLARQELEAFDARSTTGSATNHDVHEPITEFPENLQVIDGETIDLTAIPDIDVPPSDPITVEDDVLQPGQATGRDAQADMITEAACLQMVLSVLPDISVDYVLKLIQERTTDATRTTTWCENFIAGLLEGEPYPKETEEAKNKKRKREGEAEDELDSYENGERDPGNYGYESDAMELLKDEFPSVPVRHISNILHEQQTLYKAYGVIEKQVRDYGKVARSFSKINKSRNKRGIEAQLIARGSQLPKELDAAKRKVEFEAVKRRKAQEAEEAEEANLHQARINNQMGDCACCFDDIPLNRMVSCNGDNLHFYCKNCVRQQIETQMGQSRCRPNCFGVDDCNGTFSRGQLQEVLSAKTFERLEHMQQMEDLKAAGLDFLSECPFCDFKMECPPIEIDKEFRCQSIKCGKTSCRLCQKESHVPLTCEEFKKDSQIGLRHTVEEAMSAALIRHCNKCKHPFIKEFGCNKMTCTHCRNLQCYVCSKNVKDYSHFGEISAGKCPLHDNIEERHEQEVKKAADEAMAKVRAENPGLSDADLMVKVSDRVKQAEEARRNRVEPGAEAEAEAQFQAHVGMAQAHARQMIAQRVRRIPPGAHMAAPRYQGPLPPMPVEPPALQYVNPFAAAFVPMFGQPAHPVPGYQPIFPAQPIYYGAVPQQQPYQHAFHLPLIVAPCPRCYLYHPPDRRC